jgi:hypothetical protein
MAITEDYVNFETAKLLKEKGFNEYCGFWYEGSKLIQTNDDYGLQSNTDHISPEFDFSTPTLQMAMKWLRKVHNIYIDISPTYSEEEKTIHFIWQIFDSNYDGVGDCEIFYDKYEIACEEAIKYCLENLI